MYCSKCQNVIEKCHCPDAAERIEKILKPSDHLAIGPKYRELLKMRVRLLREQQVVQE